MAIFYIGALDDFADEGSADAMSLGDFGQTHASAAITKDCGTVDVERCSSDAPAFELRSPHAGTDLDPLSKG